MPYPDAPWVLNGYAFQTLHLVDTAKARLFVPGDLDLISVFPGKTLGGVYLAYYGSGSVLEYSELIVVPGLVRHDRHFGAWISHIYVDHPDSVAGGRNIWGLPKELAEFTWQDDGVEVRQEGTLLCKMRSHWKLPLWQQELTIPSLSKLENRYIKFLGHAMGNLRLVNAQLEVPTDSPFSALNLGQPWLTGGSDSWELVAGVPTFLDGRQSDRSQSRNLAVNR